MFWHLINSLIWLIYPAFFIYLYVIHICIYLYAKLFYVFYFICFKIVYNHDIFWGNNIYLNGSLYESVVYFPPCV